MSYWGGDRLRDDVRWKKFGVPPANNANYAWIQHFIHHLSPKGVAGFVLANGSMSSSQSGEGEIRKKIIEADLVDCMIALPPQLFLTTGIPACLWFLARNKANGKFRDRRGETLFIDARKMGHLIDRVHRELSDTEIAKVAGTYHAWRGEKGASKYADVPGFCSSATTKAVAGHGYVLTPGRYVGALEAEDESEPFALRMQRLIARLGSSLQNHRVWKGNSEESARPRLWSISPFPSFRRRVCCLLKMAIMASIDHAHLNLRRRGYPSFELQISMAGGYCSNRRPESMRSPMIEYERESELPAT